MLQDKLHVFCCPFFRTLLVQSRQVKRTPQDSINESIIWKIYPLVVPVTSVKFKSAFLYA